MKLWIGVIALGLAGYLNGCQVGDRIPREAPGDAHVDASIAEHGLVMWATAVFGEGKPFSPVVLLGFTNIGHEPVKVTPGCGYRLEYRENDSDRDLRRALIPNVAGGGVGEDGKEWFFNPSRITAMCHGVRLAYGKSEIAPGASVIYCWKPGFISAMYLGVSSDERSPDVLVFTCAPFPGDWKHQYSWYFANPGYEKRALTERSSVK